MLLNSGKFPLKLVKLHRIDVEGLPEPLIFYNILTLPSRKNALLSCDRKRRLQKSLPLSSKLGCFKVC